MNNDMVKKLIGTVLAFLVVTVLGVGVYAYTIYQQGTATLSQKTYKKIEDVAALRGKKVEELLG